MLVLSRKQGESVIIGDDIVVTVVAVRGDKVRLGIDARAEIRVVRREDRREINEAIERRSMADVKEEVLISPDSNKMTADDSLKSHSSAGQPRTSGSAGGGRTGGTEKEIKDLHDTVDRLTRERNQWREKFNLKLNELIDAKREVHGLSDALGDSDNAKARMVEYYEGVVRHRESNEVVVAYEVEDDIIEQTYRRDQFIDGNIPDLNDHLSVLVRVADVRPDRQIESAGEEEWFDDDGEPLSREF